MNLLELKQYLIQKRGHVCEECGMSPATLHCHHWLIHRDARFKKFLDDEHNCGLVCEACHESGIVNGIDSRMRFLQKQLGSYRGKEMSLWLRKRPAKLLIENWIFKEVSRE